MSYWAFRVRFKDSDRQWMYWRWDSEFDQTCGDDDFNVFIDMVLDQYPHGFLTAFYKHYTDEASVVGRMETVDRDLWQFLNGFERLDNISFPGVKVNISQHDHIKYTKRQAMDMMDAEADVVSAYEYDYVPEEVVG
jgi:hypothetical protein